MIYVIMVLRLLHILGGIFWVGAALTLTFFVVPAAAATLEAGQKFTSQLMQRTAFSKVILYSALITVLAGITLYGIDSNGFQSPWMSSGPGYGFGLGGVAGLIGLYFGLGQNKRSNELAQLGRIIQSQGSPPNPEQLNKLQKLQAGLKSGGMWNALFLLLASLLMATARFMVF